MMNGAQEISQVLDEIQRAESVFVTVHVGPDGDAIGSMIALTLGLRGLGKKVTAATHDPVPESCRFLPEAEQIPLASSLLGDGSGQGQEALARTAHRYDLAMVLDCGELARTGDAAALVRMSARVVNIDHHATNDRFGDVNWVDIGAAATGELIYRLLTRGLHVRLTPDIAMALYTALSTDTGSFRFSNVTSETFDIASHLLRAGADGFRVAEEVWGTVPFKVLKLLGKLLDSLETSRDGRIAWMTLTRDVLAEYQVDDDQTEGFIGYARSVKGAEVGIMFRETPEGTIRVGFRSRRFVDVASLARRFGGGGHARASGCTLAMPLEQAKDVILRSVAEELERLSATSGR